MKIRTKILSLAAILSIGCALFPQPSVSANTEITNWQKDQYRNIPITYTVSRTDQGKVVVELGDKTPDYRIGFMSSGHPRALQECSYVHDFVYGICKYYNANIIVYDNIVYEYNEDTETFVITGREGTKYGTVYDFCVNALARGNSEMLESLQSKEDELLKNQAERRNPKNGEEYAESVRCARVNLDDVNARWQARQEAIKILEEETGTKLLKNIKTVIIRGNVYKIGKDAFYKDCHCGRGCPAYHVEYVDMSDSKVRTVCGGNPFGGGRNLKILNPLIGEPKNCSDDDYRPVNGSSGAFSPEQYLHSCCTVQ